MLSKTNFIAVLLFLLLIVNISWGQDLRKSVVKIHVVSNDYDYLEPWQKLGIGSTGGSGFIIEGNKILTNAHVIANHTFVQVQLAGEEKRYTAEVVAVADICDIALLQIKDENFQRKVVPLKLGDLPSILDEVQVHGFPAGGEELSITMGVVSRIEHDYYSQSWASFLSCQLDAAVNPGNSGGPVISEGKVVGMIMQGNDDLENSNSFIPIDLIKHFLKDLEDGKLQGFPSLMIETQKIQNPDFKQYLKMNEDLSGILVKKILPDSPVKDQFRVNDILLSINNVNIDSDSKAEFRKGERTDWTHLIQSQYVGDKVNCKLLRDGKEISLDVVLNKNMDDSQLIPYYQCNKKPTYYIIGGFVFQPLTVNYMSLFRSFNDSSPTNLDYYYYYLSPTENRREIIVLNKVLADEINVGYHNVWGNDVIKIVNGKEISTMKDFVYAFESNKSKYHIIENDFGYKFILSTDKVKNESSRILEKYGIQSDRSDDLK